MRNFVPKSNSLMKASIARVKWRVNRTGNNLTETFRLLKLDLDLVPWIFFFEGNF